MRLGYITYLNLLPVYFGLETGRTPWEGEMVTGPPTRINALFQRGEVDVAPISSIEYARARETDLLLPGLAVSARGHVQSILLFSHHPPAELDGGLVSLTASSATSVVLTRVLFKRYWRVAVSYSTEPPDLDVMLTHADAALLIGDDALRAGLALGVLPWRGKKPQQTARWRGEPVYVTDLGAVWWEYTGLPMVYATFVARGEVRQGIPSVLDGLVRSRGEALRDPLGLVRAAAWGRGFPPGLVDVYLNRTIRHDLGEREQAGLLRFYAEAAAIGELERVPDLRFASV